MGRKPAKPTPPTIDAIRYDIEAALARHEGIAVWIMSKTTLMAVVRRDLTVKITHSKSVFTPVEQMRDVRLGQMVIIHAVGYTKDYEPKDPLPKDLGEADELERRTGVVVIFAHSGEEVIKHLWDRGVGA